MVDVSIYLFFFFSYTSNVVYYVSLSETLSTTRHMEGDLHLPFASSKRKTQKDHECTVHQKSDMCSLNSTVVIYTKERAMVTNGDDDHADGKTQKCSPILHHRNKQNKIYCLPYIINLSYIQTFTVTPFLLSSLILSYLE